MIYDFEERLDVFTSWVIFFFFFFFFRNLVDSTWMIPGKEDWEGEWRNKRRIGW